MAAHEPIPVDPTGRRPRPNDYPCKPGTPPGHDMRAQPGLRPIEWVCAYCDLRWQIGVGVVA